MDYKFSIFSDLQDFILSHKKLSVDELLVEIRNELGANFIKHIFQLNTPCHIIVFKDNNDKKFVIKLERAQSPVTTQKEVIWYSYIQDHNISFPHIPEFYGGYQDQEVAFYFLEYLNEYIPASKLFVEEKFSAEELASIAIDAVTSVENLFHSLPRKKDPGIVRSAFADRLQKRFSEMYEHEYLKEILEKNEIVINGSTYQNMPFYIDRLVNSPLLKDIENKELGIIHGDMHFGNILIKENNPFMFLDPNGALFLPLEYDYSKILYSTLSGYDLLHAGRYALRVKSGEYEFSLDMQQERDKITKKYIEFLGERAATVYFTNAIHTISSIPHHAKDVDETIATYLQTILILDELFRN